MSDVICIAGERESSKHLDGIMSIVCRMSNSPSRKSVFSVVLLCARCCRLDGNF